MVSKLDRKYKVHFHEGTSSEHFTFEDEASSFEMRTATAAILKTNSNNTEINCLMNDKELLPYGRRWSNAVWTKRELQY